MSDSKTSNLIFRLCQEPTTVTLEYDKDPSVAPGAIAERLYGKRNASKSASTAADHKPISSEELEHTAACGKWGSCQPGELFLRAFYDSIACIHDDPLAGVVSPPLLGSNGTIPLTIIAPLADLVRHVSNLVVRAQKEVFLATCAWSPSVAQRLICDALKELSNRAAGKSERVVVKIMYDKVNSRQLFESHQSVEPETFAGKKVLLPAPHEIPNLDLEVVNFHRPLLGTLHAKFVIIDRTVGFVQSNNMEDNDNMEMGVHLEGPIVEGLYDTALITWNNALGTAVPVHDLESLSENGEHATSNSEERIAGSYDEALQPTEGPAREQDRIVVDGKNSQLPEHQAGSPHYDADLASEITRIQSAYSPKEGETHLQAINRYLNVAARTKVAPTAEEPEPGDEFTPYITHSADNTCPIALVSRAPYGIPHNSNGFVPQNEAWLSCIRNAKSSIFIQSPDINAAPLNAALAAAVRRGVEVTCYICLGYNDAGELMPGQGGTNEMWASKLKGSLTAEERNKLHIHWYTGKDQMRPIHHDVRARSCHIKLMITDGRVGIQGSGNQDTQSWYHSQEINIMVDSEEVCRKWREGIERNQNTGRYGKGSEEDGIWRDDDGNEVEGAMGNVSAPMGWVKGVTGMIKKAQEKGGFG